MKSKTPTIGSRPTLSLVSQPSPKAWRGASLAEREEYVAKSLQSPPDVAAVMAQITAVVRATNAESAEMRIAIKALREQVAQMARTIADLAAGE